MVLSLHTLTIWTHHWHIGWTWYSSTTLWTILPTFSIVTLVWCINRTSQSIHIHCIDITLSLWLCTSTITTLHRMIIRTTGHSWTSIHWINTSTIPTLVFIIITCLLNTICQLFMTTHITTSIFKYITSHTSTTMEFIHLIILILTIHHHFIILYHIGSSSSSMVMMITT